MELWRKLTGDERSSPSEIYKEARHIFRKRHDNGARTPSLAMRSWLEAHPIAMASGGASIRALALSPGRRKPKKIDSSEALPLGAWPGDMRKVRRVQRLPNLGALVRDNETH